jgi:nucleoside-diphosphate-sugar epimerase
MSLSGKNVLVTGGAGFIGSSIVKELVHRKANVIVYDNFSCGDMQNLEEVQNSIKTVTGDILHPRFKTILIENDVEYVFHLAAEPFIPKCYYYPEKFFEVNALGTLKVLRACKEANVKRILHYSTSEVYGTAKYIPMNEDHPTRPLSTYAASKLAADRLCFTLFHEHKVPVVILRQFNTYGPRETQPYVIPEIITQLSKSNEVKLGNIKARRDFTYVEDAAKGAIELMTCPGIEGEVINMGSGQDYSIEEIVYMLGDLMGYNSVKITIDANRLRPLDVDVLICDSSKVQKLIGWEPKTDIKEGLKRTIKWFREHGNKWIWEEKIITEEKNDYIT